MSGSESVAHAGMAPAGAAQGCRQWRVKRSTHARTLLESPPEGVDLAALAPGVGHLATPEECEQLYADAVEAAGGQPALEKAAALATSLNEQVVAPDLARSHAGADVQAHQFRAWQAYDLPFMMERLGEGTAVRRHGELRLEAMADELRSDVDPAISLNVASVKKWGRASVKSRIRYGSDCSRLTDLNRAELVCPDVEIMYSAAEHLFNRWGGPRCRSDVRVVEWTDCYQEPMPGGYRHLQALVFIGGSMWEIQINTAAMLEAKKAAGHRLYKTTRFVKELLLFASMEGDLEVLEDLLAQPGVRAVADPNATRDKNGLAALHHAAFRGDAAIVRLLLDSNRFCEPADAWASDTTAFGALPLNYAMLLRSYDVALLLAQHMACTAVPRGAKECLAQALAAAVDAYEDLLQDERHEKEREKEEEETMPTLNRRSLRADSVTVRQILGVLVGMWTPNNSPTSAGGGFVGEDPLAYAFRIGAASSAQVLLDSADPWTTDHEGWLPLERAVNSGLPGSAEAAAARMLREPQPMPLAAEAAWSLARCRTPDLPNSLLSQVEANDRRLRRRIYACGALTDAEVTGGRSEGSAGSQLRQFGALDLEALKVGTSEVQCMCVALESEEVLYIGDVHGNVQKWDARSLAHTATWKGHLQRVVCVLLGSKRQAVDGKTRSRKLFSGSFDNTVRVWDLWGRPESSANCLGVLKHTEDVKALAKQGSTLFVAIGTRIALWDIEKVSSMRRCGELRGHSGVIDALEVFGSRVYSAGQGGEVRVWARTTTASGDSMQWNEVECWKGHSESFWIHHLLAGPDNSLFSAAQSDRVAPPVRVGSSSPYVAPEAQAELCFWTAGGKVRNMKRVPQAISGLQYAEGILFAADLGGNIRLWNATTAKLVSVVSACPGRISAFIVGDGSGGNDELATVVRSSGRRISELSAPGDEERSEAWKSFVQTDGEAPTEKGSFGRGNVTSSDGRFLDMLTKLSARGEKPAGTARHKSALRRPPVADLTDSLPRLRSSSRPPSWMKGMPLGMDTMVREDTVKETSSWPVAQSPDILMAGMNSAPPFPPFRRGTAVESRRQQRPPRAPVRGGPLMPV
mmetsp:Transcript_29546/g.65180  ORF Transcript_29546/g.65180 Transcript_29546/m.65180 type:complete len:1087 (+) Transcript_29546:139-3399(+)